MAEKLTILVVGLTGMLGSKIVSALPEILHQFQQGVAKGKKI